MGNRMRWTTRIARRFEAAMAWASFTFITRWGALERGYRRPYARVALRLKFAFYPLLALAALSWLAWDWHHDRKLAAAENAVFDTVIGLRWSEPVPSGDVVVVEIDDCSIEYYRGLGQGGWPWSRGRHAELLDALDRAGVRAVGYDKAGRYVDADAFIVNERETPLEVKITRTETPDRWLTSGVAPAVRVATASGHAPFTDRPPRHRGRLLHEAGRLPQAELVHEDLYLLGPADERRAGNRQRGAGTRGGCRPLPFPVPCPMRRPAPRRSSPGCWSAIPRRTASPSGTRSRTSPICPASPMRRERPTRSEQRSGTPSRSPPARRVA